MKMILVLFALLLCVSRAESYADTVVTPGDVSIAGLFSVQTFVEGSCGSVDAEAIQIHEAVRWFLDRLNKRNYIPGVTLGMDAYKTCDDSQKAAAATLQLLQSQNPVYGILGPGRSSESESVSRLLSSLPEEDRLLQLSYSATAASLSNRNIFKNFFSVITPDTIQNKVLLDLMISLKWNYIAIVFELDTYGREGAMALKAKAEEAGICVPVFVGIEPDASTNKRRLAFEELVKELERNSESLVIGLVFYGLGTTARVMFEYMDHDMEMFQVIASEAIGLKLENVQNTGGDVFRRAKGLLSVSPPVYDPAIFRQHWLFLHSDILFLKEQMKDNDWLVRYMSHITGCDFSQVSSISQSCIDKAIQYAAKSEMSVYVGYALIGVASFAKTLKSLHLALCGGNSGLCSAMQNVAYSRVLQQMSTISVDMGQDFNELANFNISFRFNEGELLAQNVQDAVQYSVYNLKKCEPNFCYKTVGNFTNGKLTVASEQIKAYDKNGKEMSVLQAQCQPSYFCKSCQSSKNIDGVFVIPGDYYIVGLIPVHNKGDTALECGDLRTSISVDLAESIVYAVDRINKKRDVFVSVLGNKKVGVVVIDTCNSPLVVKERVIQLERGELILKDGVNSSSIKNRIIGYIGPLGSALSVPLSSVMTELDRLYISYASTSSSLSNRALFPNFMRTASPDYKQTKVLMYIAKELKSTYVQIIYTDEEYGRAGKDSLLQNAREFKICVAQSLGIAETSDSTIYRGYLSELRKYPHAKVIIVFVRSHVTQLLMTVLNEAIGTGEFVFIGGESWGKRLSVVQNNNKLVRSLTLAQELPKVQAFRDFFDEIDIRKTSNPWYQEYIERKASCYFPMSFNKISSIQCTPERVAQYFEADGWVPFIVNGVSALALGFSEGLRSKCFGSFEMCPEFSTSELIKHVKEVRLDMFSDGRRVRVFDDNGEGNVGYTISQIVRDGSEIIYKQVGVSSEDGIQFNKPTLDPETDFASTCQNDHECGLCKTQFNETEPSSNSLQPAVTALAVCMTLFLVALIVLIVLGVIWYRKMKARKENEYDPYLTVVPDDKVPSGGYMSPVFNDSGNSGSGGTTSTSSCQPPSVPAAKYVNTDDILETTADAPSVVFQNNSA